MATQVFPLRYQVPSSLLSPLQIRHLMARGRLAGFDHQEVRDTVREGLDQHFLLSQGQAFLPSPIGAAIIALDHSLQVGPRDEDQAPAVTVHEVLHAIQVGTGTSPLREDCSYRSLHRGIVTAQQRGLLEFFPREGALWVQLTLGPDGGPPRPPRRGRRRGGRSQDHGPGGGTGRLKPGGTGR